MSYTKKMFSAPDTYTWRKSFAYLPVKTISGRYVWMKTVYKQKFWCSGDLLWGQNYHVVYKTEYGELFDIIKDGFNDE